MRCAAVVVFWSARILVPLSYQHRSFTVEPVASHPDEVPSATGASSSASNTTNEAVRKARDELIDGIIQRDKEIFTLKRQHELSMMRAEQTQNRVLKDQEDRGIYYEQNCNVHTFDSISVGLYSQRNTYYHTMMVQRLREFKIGLTIAVTALVWCYLYRKYMANDDMLYVDNTVGIYYGSRAHVVRDLLEKRKEEESAKQLLAEQNARV